MVTGTFWLSPVRPNHSLNRTARRRLRAGSLGGESGYAMIALLLQGSS